MNTLSAETAALWDALYAIFEPVRWSGASPDPSAVENLTPRLAEYKAFLHIRLADFKLVSRHLVDRRTVESAHADFLTRSEEARDALEKWPKEVVPFVAKQLAARPVLYLWNIKPELEHEAALVPQSPVRRVRCNPADRSICLDEKQIACGVGTAYYAFISLLIASYPNPITFPAMQKLSTELAGLNQTRFKKQMPPELVALVQAIRGKGHVLKLPKSRS